MPPPTCPETPVRYLDLDGVCHCDQVYRHPRRGIYIDQRRWPGRRLFEWAHHVEGALAPYPKARIVLSTSWVRVLGYSGTVKRLPAGLRPLVIGATYHTRYTDLTRELGPYASSGSLRGQEVWADIQRRQPAGWVAVDDTDEGWTESARDHLVLCDSATGLSDPETRARLHAAMRRHFA